LEKYQVISPYIPKCSFNYCRTRYCATSTTDLPSIHRFIRQGRPKPN